MAGTVPRKRRRWFYLVLAASVSALTGLVYTSQLLSLLTPDHWCRDLDVETLQEQLPLPPEDSKKFSVPLVRVPGRTHRSRFSQCQKYGGDLVGAYVVWVSARRPEHRDTGVAIYCNQGWTYNYTNIFPTIPSQMNWVCGAKWKPYVVHCVFWLAAAAGILLWSTASLRLGRPLVLLLALTLYLLGGLATLLATGFFSILVSRMVMGLSHFALRHQALLSALEAGDPGESRLILAVFLAANTLATIIISFTGLLVTSWWWLTVIAMLPTIPCMMLTARLFLKTSQRQPLHLPHDDDIIAFHICNDVKILEAPNEEHIQVEERPQLRTPLLHLVWMASSLCYFGLTHNAPSLVSSALGVRPTDAAVFSSCWYAALMEAPCWGLPLLLPSSWRRRWAIGASLATTAILTVSPALVSYGASAWVVLSLSLLARLAATAAYYTVLQHRMEVPLRDETGQVAGEALGGVSVALVPLIASLGEVNSRLPLLVLGSAAVVGALLSLWLKDRRINPTFGYMRISSWLDMLRQVQVSSRFSSSSDESGSKLDVSFLPYRPLECI
ncbi:solute carrier family 22 member 1 [Anabrus simplex]|uniref:solute carrier family 22 member 1 n=1 Tax=Anabrus simplex TaxID=316456 RepID=UPI0035A2F5FD